MHNQEDVFARAWNSLLGLIWGDILGSFFEFKPPSIIKSEQLSIPALKSRTNVFGHAFGHHTDDTALTLAALDAFGQHAPGSDLYDRHMRCALAYLERGGYTAHGHCADIGNTTAYALMSYKRGMPDAQSEESASGNGFIMRLLPFAIVSLLCVPEADKQAFYSRSSALTHASLTAQEVAYQLGLYLEALLAGEMAPSRPSFRDTTDNAWSAGGYVVGTANIALDVLANARSLNEAIFSCIRYGYDTDTNAAVCAMMAGVIFGAEEVEQDSIRYLPEIQRLFQQFCSTLKAGLSPGEVMP